MSCQHNHIHGLSETTLLCEGSSEAGQDPQLGYGSVIPQMIISKNTRNLLVLFELQHLKHLSTVNLLLCIFSLLYVAINLVGLDWNSQDVAYREHIEVSMHMLEFWATLCFSFVEVCALVFTPKSLTSIARGTSPALLKLMVFMNIMTAGTAAMLYTMDPVNNEVHSHNIEYTNEVLMAFIDFLFLKGLLPQLMPKLQSLPSRLQLSPRANRSVALPDDDYGNGEKAVARSAVWSDRANGVFISLACLFAGAQVYVYNALPNGEQYAHWMEFSFGCIAGSISFWFCMPVGLLLFIPTVALAF